MQIEPRSFRISKKLQLLTKIETVKSAKKTSTPYIHLQKM